MKLEKAQTLLGIAVQVIGIHDELASNLMRTRADMEATKLLAPEKLEGKNLPQTYAKMERDLEAYRVHILSKLASITTWEQFRRYVSSAQVQLDVVAQFQARVAQQEFFIALYRDSATVPTQLDNGEEYSEIKEVAELETIRKQLVAAEALFITTAQALDIGPMSDIVVPRIQV